MATQVGRTEVKEKGARLVIRYNGSKENYEGGGDGVSGLGLFVKQRLVEIQDAMLAKATRDRNSKLKVVMEWKDFVPALNDKCLCLTPFCDEEAEEEKVKEASRNEALQAQGDEEDEDERTATSIAAKTLCKPSLPQAGLPDVAPIEGLKCFFSGKPATAWVLWGRSY